MHVSLDSVLALSGKGQWRPKEVMYSHMHGTMWFWSSTMSLQQARKGYRTQTELHLSSACDLWCDVDTAQDHSRGVIHCPDVCPQAAPVQGQDSSCAAPVQGQDSPCAAPVQPLWIKKV